MMHRQINPGSIHIRIAALDAKMEDAVAAGNLVLYANLLKRKRLYASVYMTDTQKKAYDELPGLTVNDNRTDWQVYDDLLAREEFLLDILKDHDVFAKGKHNKGDASSLDDDEDLVTA